jgi:hypothetical protein
MSSAVKAVEQVKVDLDDAEVSTAKVSRQLDADNVWVSNSIEFYVSGDVDDQEVYVNIQGHTYTSVDGHEAVSSFSNLFTHRFTRAEAEALLAVLSREVNKL